MNAMIEILKALCLFVTKAISIMINIINENVKITYLIMSLRCLFIIHWLPKKISLFQNLKMKYGTRFTVDKR